MIDGTLAGIVASGAYVAVLPTGVLFAGRVVPKFAAVPLREQFAAALALGVCVWSILYVILALTGTFSAQGNGVEDMGSFSTTAVAGAPWLSRDGSSFGSAVRCIVRACCGRISGLSQG
jgi:hypothetical protein